MAEDVPPNAETAPPSRVQVRRAIRRAVHEMWCGPAPRTCGANCEGNLTARELTAILDVVMPLIRRAQTVGTGETS